MTRTYGKWQCRICLRWISNNGLARSSHKRSCEKKLREARKAEREKRMGLA